MRPLHPASSDSMNQKSKKHPKHELFNVRISHIIDSVSFVLYHSEFDIDMSDAVACRPCSHGSNSKADRIETHKHVTV